MKTGLFEIRLSNHRVFSTNPVEYVAENKFFPATWNSQILKILQFLSLITSVQECLLVQLIISISNQSAGIFMMEFLTN